jgi:putative FmdB family regulatory protein
MVRRQVVALVKVGSNPTGHPTFYKGVPMAVYEYQCTECGHEFEEEHKITSENDITNCPKCMGISEKQISLSSFTMTGYASINGYSKGNVTR